MTQRFSRRHSLSRSLFRSELLEIGLFDCPRHHPLFQDSGPVWEYLVVFPRHAVRIEHDGSDPVVADPQVITLYNDGQEYRRRELSDYGDQSIWLRFRRTEVVEALVAGGHAHSALEQQPFAWTHSQCDSATYLLQRRLTAALVKGTESDFLLITETALHLLSLAVAGVPVVGRHDRSAAGVATQRRHRTLVSRCQELLTTCFHERLTLEFLARVLATTPFHLSRVYSRLTGKTIHQQLLELRLRRAVDLMIDEPDERITDIGLDLGFSTPSHFSQSFQRHFGISPRQFRA